MRALAVVVAVLVGRAGVADPGVAMLPPPIDPTPLAAAAERDLMWPLQSPPEETPHLALLAWYGAAWPAPCATKPIAGTRAEVVEYVQAWCRPADERADALYGLLDRSGAEVREAIRADLVDVVAANDLPGTARYWLERHHLGEMVAAVGASQLDARRADAEQWVDLNRLQVRERDCHLIAHAIRAGEAQAKGMLDLLASESPRTVCAKLRDALECPLVTGERKTVWHDEVELATEANDDVSVCDRFVPIHGDVTQVARMYASALVARWPQPGTKAAAVARWLSFARVAAHSLWWDPVTDDLALAAIDAALASADCTPAAADDAHAIASDLGARLDRAHDRARDARVAAASARACGM